MPAALLTVPVEDSRAQRQQRLQSKFRDRGGIFVPSGKNELVDILLARAVNGESPPRSAAKGKGKGRARERERSSSPVKGGRKIIGSGNAVKKAAVKKRACSVQDVDESDHALESSRPPTAKKSTRGGKAKVADSDTDKPPEKAQKQRARPPKSASQPAEGISATDGHDIQHSPTKPIPKRKARSKPPSKSKSKLAPQSGDDDDEGALAAPTKPKAASKPSLKRATKLPEESYLANDFQADTSIRTDLHPARPTAKQKSKALPQPEDDDEPSARKKPPSRKPQVVGGSRKRRRIGQSDSEDDGPDWKPQLESRAATRVRRGKKADAVKVLKPPKPQHKAIVISEDEGYATVDKAKPTKTSTSKSRSKPPESREDGRIRPAKTKALATSKGSSYDEDEDFIQPTKGPRKRIREDTEAQDEDDAPLVKLKPSKSRLPPKSNQPAQSKDDEGNRPGVSSRRLRSRTPTTYLEVSDDEEEPPPKRNKGPSIEGEDVRRTLSVVLEVDEDEEGSDRGRPVKKHDARPNVVKKRKKELHEDEGTDMQPHPPKRPRSKAQTTTILDITEVEGEALSLLPRERSKTAEAPRSRIGGTNTRLDRKANTVEDEGPERLLKQRVHAVEDTNDSSPAARKKRNGLAVPSVRTSKSKANGEKKSRTSSRNVKNSTVLDRKKPTTKPMLDTPDSRLDYDSEPDPLDLLS